MIVLVSHLLWDDEVAEDWESEGEWREAYVFEASVGDWQRVVDAVHALWRSSYTEDGEPFRHAS